MSGTRIARWVVATTGMVICVVMLTVGIAHGQASAVHDLAGEWSGVLGGQLHLVLTISKSSAGDLSGSLNSVDQHATLALANVKLSGSAVHFEVPRVGGVYDGSMNKKGDGISGTWTQTGVHAQPLDFKRTGAAPVTPTTTPSENEPTAASSTAAKEHTPKPLTLGIDTVVDATPVAFKSGGRWHLAYELHIANMDQWNYALTEIEVVPAGAPDTSIASFSGETLDRAFTFPGVGKKDAAGPSTLRPGEQGVVYLWVTADSLDAIPRGGPSEN